MVGGSLRVLRLHFFYQIVMVFNQEILPSYLVVS
jgi:hypothetical protein